MMKLLRTASSIMIIVLSLSACQTSRISARNVAGARETHGGDPCTQQTKGIIKEISKLLAKHEDIASAHHLNLDDLNTAIDVIPVINCSNKKGGDCNKRGVVRAECSFILGQGLRGAMLSALDEYLRVMSADADSSASDDIIRDLWGYLPTVYLPEISIALPPMNKAEVEQSFKSAALDISCDEINKRIGFKTFSCSDWSEVLRSTRVQATFESLFVDGKPVAAKNVRSGGSKEVFVNIDYWRKTDFDHRLLAMHEYLNLIGLDDQFEITSSFVVPLSQ